MIEYIKVNKKGKVYIYKVKQKEKIVSKSLNSIKYYPCYYISSILYGNFYYSLVL